jgi:hypothetical protein
MFADPCIIVKFIKKNPTRRNNVSKFHYSKTALAASGFSYVEGCWTCSWWTLSGVVTYEKPEAASAVLGS